MKNNNNKMWEIKRRYKLECFVNIQIIFISKIVGFTVKILYYYKSNFMNCFEERIEVVSRFCV